MSSGEHISLHGCLNCGPQNDGGYVLDEDGWVFTSIGRGGNGEVFRAERGTCRHAVKTFNSKEAADMEISNVEAVQHRSNTHIVSYLYTGACRRAQLCPDGGSMPVLVMELFDTDLFQIASEELMSPRQLEHLCTQLLISLAELHTAGMVHGDLKPENVLINRTSPWTIKLGDFGNSYSVWSEHRPGGTIWYNAPEDVVGRNNHGTGSDIFSLALVILCIWNGAPLLPESLRQAYLRPLSSKDTRSHMYACEIYHTVIICSLIRRRPVWAGTIMRKFCRRLTKRQLRDIVLRHFEKADEEIDTILRRFEQLGRTSPQLMSLISQMLTPPHRRKSAIQLLQHSLNNQRRKLRAQNRLMKPRELSPSTRRFTQ